MQSLNSLPWSYFLILISDCDWQIASQFIQQQVPLILKLESRITKDLAVLDVDIQIRDILKHLVQICEIRSLESHLYIFAYILKLNGVLAEQIQKNLHIGTYQSIILLITDLSGKCTQRTGKRDESGTDTLHRSFVEYRCDLLEAGGMCIRGSQLTDLGTVLGIKKRIAELGDTCHLNTETYLNVRLCIIEITFLEIQAGDVKALLCIPGGINIRYVLTNDIQCTLAGSHTKLCSGESCKCRTYHRNNLLLNLLSSVTYTERLVKCFLSSFFLPDAE